MSNIAIKVTGVKKTFKMPHERYTSLKQNAIHLFSKRGYSKFEAVKGLDFEVKEGEFFGIVGRNGCGKSTLLKMLAGIYVPTHGTVAINGSLSPFIELGVGFNPELSARDNIFLNGAILGLTRKEIREKFDEIIGFAELEDFVDQKLKNFSSGMQVRLAFSIAIQAQSDILLIDEVLAVGDSSFQKKCFDVFKRLKKEGKTIVFVTHDMANVQDFCDRVLVIDAGKSLGVFGPDQASEMYQQLNAANDITQLEKISTKRRWGSNKVTIKSVAFSSKGKKAAAFHTGEPLDIIVQLQNHQPVKNLLTGFAFYTAEGTHITGPNSTEFNIPGGTTEVIFHIDQLPLLEGTYQLTAAIYDKSNDEALDYIDKGFSFAVIGPARAFGQIALFGNWSKS